MAMKVVNDHVVNYPAQTGANAQTMFVLTQDDAGLYAVYVGNVRDWKDATQRKDRANWVMGNGAKVNLQVARMHFPFITAEYYRS